MSDTVVFTPRYRTAADLLGSAHRTVIRETVAPPTPGLSSAGMESPAFTIEELSVPERPGAPGWTDFVAAVRVRNTVETHGYGTDVLNYTAEEVLPGWLTLEHSPRRLFVARTDAVIVGRAGRRATQAGPSARRSRHALHSAS